MKANIFNGGKRSGFFLSLLVMLIGTSFSGCGPSAPKRTEELPPPNAKSSPDEKPASSPLAAADGPATDANAGKVAAATAPSPTTGKGLYLLHCAACHGENGDGKGIASTFVFPKPRDFRSGHFRLVSSLNGIVNERDLDAVLVRGMPGSSMPPWPQLSAEQRKLIIAEVLRLREVGAHDLIVANLKASGDDEDVTEEQLKKMVSMKITPGEPLSVPELPAASAESIARGKVLYVKQTCQQCHGETGKGDGVKKMVDIEGYPARPRDLTRGIFKGGHDAASIYRRIAIGMPGTQMPSSHGTISGEQITDLVHFILSLSTEPARQAAVLNRAQIVARRAAALPQEVNDTGWNESSAVAVRTMPLWWRDDAEPDLQVQAAHDGKTLAIRLSWRDTTANNLAQRTEDFEDMAAVQLFRGPDEPFLGMGAAAHAVDLWLWKAGWQKVTPYARGEMDDYPYVSENYRELVKDPKASPDFLTARAAGNPNTNADRASSAANLAAKGFGSTTFRPVASTAVKAKSDYQNGRWVVVLTRSLTVSGDGGLALASGEKISAAFALWDGAARDRNGQKQISIWHDLKLE